METLDLLDIMENTIPSSSGGIVLGVCSGGFLEGFRHAITVWLATAMTGYPPYGLTDRVALERFPRSRGTRHQSVELT
jgi:hypothetical protein